MADAHPLVERRRQVLADVVGADRKLSMPPIDEHRELDAVGPAEVEERVDRGPNRPPREEDVVDEDAGSALEREVQLRAADDGLRMERRRPAPDENVVAVERDVDRTERGLDPTPLGDERLEPPRERDASRVDADESEARHVVVALDQLVRESRKRPPEGVFVEDLARPAARGGIGLHRTLLPGLTGPA